jgi:hypothetical protein
MSPTIAKESKVTNWAKIEDAQLADVFAIFYPDIDATVIKLSKAQMAAMVEKQAGKKTAEEIIEDHANKQKKRAEALPAEYVALSYPDGIQDVLNRVGTRIVVAEKYPDTTEGRIKAVSDLKARLHRLNLTLEQAQAQPIKEKATRAPSQRFDVVPFDLTDTNAVPTGYVTIINALAALDTGIKFGKRKGAKAGILIRLPELTGKFNHVLNLPPEYAIPSEKTAKAETPTG